MSSSSSTSFFVKALNQQSLKNTENKVIVWVIRLSRLEWRFFHKKTPELSHELQLSPTQFYFMRLICCWRAHGLSQTLETKKLPCIREKDAFSIIIILSKHTLFWRFWKWSWVNHEYHCHFHYLHKELCLFWLRK